jgi:hypothetical protein
MRLGRKLFDMIQDDFSGFALPRPLLFVTLTMVLSVD